MGGRVQLIQTVLSSMIFHSMSLHDLPKKTLKKIERIFRDFFWAGISKERRRAWVAWEDICKPKSEGGLGLKAIDEYMVSFRMKMAVRIHQGESIWAKFLLKKYGSLDNQVRWRGAS